MFMRFLESCYIEILEARCHIFVNQCSSLHVTFIIEVACKGPTKFLRHGIHLSHPQAHGHNTKKLSSVRNTVQWHPAK